MKKILHEWHWPGQGFANEEKMYFHEFHKLEEKRVVREWRGGD